MKPSQIDIKSELEKNQIRLRNNFFATQTDTYSIKVGTMWVNTARAYTREKCYINYIPTSIFKHWLHHKYFGDADTLRQLQTGTNFGTIHASAIDGLKSFWNEKEPDVKGMEYYHFAKLIDLLFKSVTRWKDLPKIRQEWYFANVNVPLDKYSLIALKECVSDETIRELRLKRNPSMGDVESSVHYQEIQSAIKTLIAPFPPLLFDLYAWDYLRRTRIAGEEKFELIKAK